MGTTLGLRENANKKIDKTRELLAFQENQTIGKMTKKEKKAFKALEFWVKHISNKLDFSNARIYLTKVYNKEKRLNKKTTKHKSAKENFNLNLK